MAQSLVQRLVGTNVKVLSSSLSCNTGGSGQFTTGTSNLGLTGGVLLGSGEAVTDNATGTVGANGAASLEVNAINPAGPGDPDLDAIVSPRTTQSACVLTFSFIPDIDTVSELRFNYVFASEEYPEYACSNFNDAFGFFLTGGTTPHAYSNTNLALIPNTTVPVAINSVNPGPGNFGTASNCTPPGSTAPYSAFYVDNTGGTTVTYDGFTTVLQAQALLQPCSTYTIKMAVANVSDNGLQSAVFLAENSFAVDNARLELAGTTNIDGDSLIEGCMQVNLTASRETATPRRRKICLSYGGTATFGVDYPQLPDTIIIPPGATSAFIPLAPFQDGIAEPHESVIIRQVNCCSKEPIDSFTLYIQDSIEVRLLSRDTFVCGNASPFRLAISSEPKYTYRWEPAATALTPDDSVTLVQPKSNTTYTATVSYLGCPPVQRSVFTGVEPIPLVDISLGGDTTLCLRDSIQFKVSVQPDTFQLYNYFWAPTRYLSDPYAKEPRFFTQDFRNNLYVLTVQTPLGCTGSDTIKDLRTRPPFDLVNVTPTRTIPYGNSVQLNAENALYYSWTPTTGLSDPLLPNPVATPEVTTVYTVLGENYYGCRDTAQVTVNVDFTMGMFIPTAFSPDGDGRNDDFSVRHWSFQKLQEFRIFNRWGKQVFYTNDITVGWDGRVNGELQPMGVYNYIIRAVRPDGVSTMYKGDVTLVR